MYEFKKPHLHPNFIIWNGVPQIGDQTARFPEFGGPWSGINIWKLSPLVIGRKFWWEYKFEWFRRKLKINSKSNMIQKNEIIKVISNLNFDGFLKGTNEANETGLVPSNFVQLIK